MLDAQNNKRTQLLTQIHPSEGQRLIAWHLADIVKSGLQKDRYGMLHMMFKLGQYVEKKWSRLKGYDYLTKGITGVKFKYDLDVAEVDLIAAWFKGQNRLWAITQNLT